MSIPWHTLSDRFPAGSIETDSIAPVAGGDINSSFRFNAGGETYFSKFNDSPALLQTEARNLQILSAGPLRTPGVIFSDIVAGWGVLVLEYLPLRSSGDEKELGRQLAQLHGCTGEFYGLDYDNFIGHTPQQNMPDESWADFWVKCRLAPQLELAQTRGYCFATDTILRAAAAVLAEHQPSPSLLHGDLWSGNKGYLADGTPVVFDPACYYGDRETDIAFTRVFGGFSADFYRAYTDEWPLPAGADAREGLYNLYHLLNHLNLFGRGYLGACQREVEFLLTAIRQ